MIDVEIVVGRLVGSVMPPEPEHAPSASTSPTPAAAAPNRFTGDFIHPGNGLRPQARVSALADAYPPGILVGVSLVVTGAADPAAPIDSNRG